MTTAELIYQKVKGLPQDKQAEILDFVEFLDLKTDHQVEESDVDWASFSLAAAMRGMESEDIPEYSLPEL
jgi:hypothetical protein